MSSGAIYSLLLPSEKTGMQRWTTPWLLTNES